MMYIISAVFRILGAVIVLIGSIGMVKLPDGFSRLHSAGVVDTLGAWMILLGLMFLSGSIIIAFKLMLMFLLLFFLSPVTSHGLVNSALLSGLKPRLENKKENPSD